MALLNLLLVASEKVTSFRFVFPSLSLSLPAIGILSSADPSAVAFQEREGESENGGKETNLSHLSSAKATCPRKKEGEEMSPWSSLTFFCLSP